MCKECGEAILSDSMFGPGSQEVHLYLLKDGKVEQKMTGRYDSYGRVFDENGVSVEWDRPWSGIRNPLRDGLPATDMKANTYKKTVCDLMHDHDESSGIAAVHVKCGNTVPTTESDADPNQGWGS